MEQNFERNRLEGAEVLQESPEVLKAREFFSAATIEQKLKGLLAGVQGADRKSYLFEQLAGAQVYFPGKEQEFKSLLADLKAGEYSTDENLAHKVGENIHEFAAGNFSIQALAEVLAEIQQDQAFERINDLLTYGGNRDLIHIHLDPVPGSLDGKNPREKVEYI